MHCKAIVAKHANAPGSEQILNIGSEISVEIQHLVEIALRCAGVERVVLRYKFNSSQPVGVGSRNSNNELIKETLGWEPSMSLEDDGMRLTGQWMRKEVEMTLEGYQDGDAVLWDLQLSKKVDLKAERIIFAVPRQLKGVRAVFEMDDLARYMLLGVFDFPLRFISSLMRMTSIFVAREWKRLDIFDEDVVPEKFVNQVGDPFLCRSLSSLGVLDDGSVSGFEFCWWQQ